MPNGLDLSHLAGPVSFNTPVLATITPSSGAAATTHRLRLRLKPCSPSHSIQTTSPPLCLSRSVVLAATQHSTLRLGLPLDLLRAHGKRRLSSIVTTVVRSHKLHHSNGARVSLSPTTLDPNPDWDTIQGVHQDVPTMATGTAGRSLDGLVKGAAISTESFWSADLPVWRSGEAQHSEAGPSRSSSIHSRRGTCTPTTLTPSSPTANKLLSPPFDVVSTRLAPSNEPTPPTTYRSAQHLDGQSAADLECTGAPLLSASRWQACLPARSRSQHHPRPDLIRHTPQRSLVPSPSIGPRRYQLCGAPLPRCNPTPSRPTSFPPG